MLGRVNTKKTTPTHNITKLLKTKTKVLKAAGRKTKKHTFICPLLGTEQVLEKYLWNE